MTVWSKSWQSDQSRWWWRSGLSKKCEPGSASIRPCTNNLCAQAWFVVIIIIVMIIVMIITLHVDDANIVVAAFDELWANVKQMWSPKVELQSPSDSNYTSHSDPEFDLSKLREVGMCLQYLGQTPLGKKEQREPVFILGELKDLAGAVRVWFARRSFLRAGLEARGSIRPTVLSP